jgi:CubicO group peptidase (beta-lactamase class C family)
MRRLMILAPLLALLVHPFPTQAAPDEELLGKSAGYPLGTRENWFFDERVRVGSFSHLDELLPHNTLKKAATPRPLPKAADAPDIRYRFEDKDYSLDDFLAHQRVTGFMLIRNGEVIAERYQYDRTAPTRFVSHSMAKSIVAIAVGMALSEGKIASLDDKVAKYVPQLAGHAYGETAIRNILRMSSGVKFSELYDGNDDLTRFVRTRIAEGSIAALNAFDTRDAEPGARFHYASSETVVLTVLMREVTGMTLSEYLTPRLWQPMGAESDATWVRSADGTESGFGNFNATLRDYGRLGILLANDGALDGKQIIPRDYLLEATDWHRQPDAFKPERATSYFGYGYQFWPFPGEKRRFALLGVFGQAIFVDPGLKLVMVTTAATKTADLTGESYPRERGALWRAVVDKFGSW